MAGPASRGTDEEEKKKEEGKRKEKVKEEVKEEEKEDEEGKEEVRSEEDEEDEATPASTATTTAATPAEDASAASSTTSTAAPVVKQLPSSSRAMRNMAEKMRRDKLNNYIGELATLVPMVSSSPRRLDKTSVLRLSATYIRIHRTLIPQDGPPRPFLPVALKDYNFSEKVLDDMDGFLLVVLSTGKIVFVSQQVERLLGHTQNDLLGQSVLGITHADDHKLLTSNLNPGGDTEESVTGGNKCCSVIPGDKDQSSQSSLSLRSPSSCSSNGPTTNRRVSFHLRLTQRAVGRGEAAGYEMVHIVGQLRSATSEESQTALAGKGEAVMVAVVKVCRERQIPELSLMEVCKDEYLTRHGLNGEIINVDHRISVIAGYMADEVKGQSAFHYMHEQDARWTIIALQQMFTSPDGSGSSCYRLKCKTGQYIYLRTNGHCEFDRSTGKFDTFVCINTLISEEEGKKAVEEMKQRYSASIAASSGVEAPPPIFEMLSGKFLEAPERPHKALKAAPEEIPDIASSSSSLLTITTNKAFSPKGNPHMHLPGAQLTELHRFETITEEIIAHTPKSFSSTSSPPPLPPVLYASNSPSSYIYDPSLAIEASHTLPYSPSETSPRLSERQFGPSREGTCLPVPNTLKRPADSPPHTCPSKRLHQSQPLAQQILEPILPVNDPSSWPHLNCPPTLEATHLEALPMQTSDLATDSPLLVPVGGVVVSRDAVAYDPQLLPIEGSECMRPDPFLEDENHFSALGCNDLSSLYRGTEIPDLREDLEILSMEVDPALLDQSLHQIQDSEGDIILSDSVVASSEDQSIEDTLHGGIQRSHQRLRLRLDSQGRKMASLERELSGLTGTHLIGEDLARLRVERKKQMRMLHTLKQEHRSTLANKEKTKSFSMQNVGV